MLLLTEQVISKYDVYFTAPQSGKVTLTLSKEEGEGSAYFDDVRVTETTMDVLKKDKDGNVVGMKQNFEDNVQGVYPFVIGAIEGVEDNRTDLSELHGKYTQAGWDVKKMDDVLTKNDPKSNWSVKTNGLCQAGNLVMQTIPQNFRFEEGKKYKVSFDYQSGSDGIYGVVVGNGEVKGNEKVTELAKAMGSKVKKHMSLKSQVPQVDRHGSAITEQQKQQILWVQVEQQQTSVVIKTLY